MRQRELDAQTRLAAEAEARVRDQRRAIRRLAAAFAVAVGLAAAAGLLGWEARRQRNAADTKTAEAIAQAKVAESRRLAALSDSVRPSRLDQAMLLAVEASQEDTIEAWGSLHRCLVTRPEVSRFSGFVPEGVVTSVAFGPRGVIAAGYGRFGGGVGGVVLLDAKGQRLRPNPVEVKEGGVSCVAFGSGGVIAAGYARRTRRPPQRRRGAARRVGPAAAARAGRSQ